jgi:perosamine synthetase
MKHKIKLFEPHIHSDSIEMVSEVLQSGWIGLGPKVEQFENAIANYLGARHVVALNSGTEALRAAIVLSEIPYGARIITTPNTFVSTNHVIIQHGYRPVFADIDPSTGSISLDHVEEILKDSPLQKEIRAIMVVHYGGMPVDLYRLYWLAESHGLEVIEDCAHAFGAEYDGFKVGSKSQFACFSFHAVKPLGIGDGGALVTNSHQVADTARQWRWLGINKSTIDRTKHDKYSWDYEVPIVGMKSHMNDIMAAIGLGQLKHFEEDQGIRRMLVQRYKDNFENNDRLFVVPPNGEGSAWHLMVVQFGDTETRDEVRMKLESNGVQTGLHYKPNYLYPMYSSYACTSKLGMETFYNTSLTLPLHLNMSIDDVDYICNIINRISKE